MKRIFETGNAAVAFVGDKIEVGDQLAAVNGLSAMYKNVAEVCRLLASASNPESIELTFVRYVGPLRVASIDQQGYEVIDTKLSKSSKFSPNTLAKKISFARPRSPKTNSTNPISRKPEPNEEEVSKSADNSAPVVTSSEVSSPKPKEQTVTPISQNSESRKKKKERKKIFSFFCRKTKKQQQK